MRICGILIIGFCVAAVGFYITNRLILKSKQLSKIIYLINFTEQKIKYRKETVKEILSSISKDKDFGFLFNDKISFEKICFENCALYIENEQKKSLYDFFSGLGKSDLNGQVEHCNLYREIFESYLLKNDEENRSKIKLYPSLSILLGMLVILILF